jgi:ABC-type multidrug transport system permease subunit/predicted  nucleic acid-binding Zn-ribbon protein
MIAFSQSSINYFATSFVQKKLTGLWSQFNEIGKGVSAQEKIVQEFKAKLDSSETSLKKIEADLDSVNINELKTTLASEETRLQSGRTAIDNFKLKVDSFALSYNEMKSKLNVAKANYVSSRANLLSLKGKISTELASFDATIMTLTAIAGTVPDSVDKTTMLAKLNEFSTLKSDVTLLMTSLDNVILAGDELSDENSALNVNINKVSSLFVEVNSAYASAVREFSGASSSFDSVDTKISVFSNSINDVKTMIADARTARTDIYEKLDDSLKILGDFSTKVSNFQDVDPNMISSPIIFKTTPVYSTAGISQTNSQSWSMVLSDLVLVLMLSCMLLTCISVISEKNQNIEIRTMISPASREILAFGKIIGQLLIALLEAAIIFGFAFFSIPAIKLGFGLTTLANPLLIIFLTIFISVCFISLGLLISTFTKNQSTAILVSLLLIVPMIFLSGLITPVDFMSKDMRFISSIMPMTLAHGAMVELIVKGYSILELLPKLLVMGIYMVISVGLYIYYRKK